MCRLPIAEVERDQIALQCAMSSYAQMKRREGLRREAATKTAFGFGGLALAGLCTARLAICGNSKKELEYATPRQG